MPRPPCRIHQQRNSPSRRGDSAQDVRRCDGCAGLAASSASYTRFAATRQGCARLHRWQRSRRGSAGVPRRAAKVLRVALLVTRTSWQRQRCGNHRQRKARDVAIAVSGGAIAVSPCGCPSLRVRLSGVRQWCGSIASRRASSPRWSGQPSCAAQCQSWRVRPAHQ